MRGILRVGLATLVSLSVWSSQADAGRLDNNLQKRMLDDLDVIRTTFQTAYAPKEWKQAQNGWDLEQAISEAQAKVEDNPDITIKDFQQIVRDFFRSTRDYHVNVLFLSTEASMLPFSVRSAEGRYFLVDVDRKRLSETFFPFYEGDEIVRFDGKPIADAVAELAEKELGGAHKETDLALAELMLTNRIGMKGTTVPEGPVLLSFKRAGESVERSVQLIWEHHEELIVDPTKDLAIKKNLFQIGADWAPQGNADDDRLKLPAPQLFDKQVVIPEFPELKKLQSLWNTDVESPHGLGVRESVLPALGEIYWESTPWDPFEAYSFKLDDGRVIGFIRLPHYMAGDYQAESFGQIIQHFESTTDALVIDQLNNPGGSVFYVYALASMLTQQPLSTPRHQMTITQEEVLNSVRNLQVLDMISTEEEAQWVFGPSMGGYPVTYQMVIFFRNFCRFIIDEWKAGRTLTRPYYLAGVDHINPHPRYSYSKPVLLLTNELDFSGGDFFPAILQDNKRVRTLGSRTAGAGGYVEQGWFRNALGIYAFSYTGSIAQRADGSRIEDLGVTPDVSYDVTALDRQSNYSEYAQRIRDELVNMLGPIEPGSDPVSGGGSDDDDPWGWDDDDDGGDWW